MPYWSWPKLEALALNEYRAGRMPRAELQRVLGFHTGGELESFLKAHGEGDVPTGDEFDQDVNQRAIGARRQRAIGTYTRG